MNGLAAGVFNVDFFDFNDRLIVSSRTLIDSAFNFTITSEEARGGFGNALLGRYYHTSGFGLTLTDQVWNLQYLALNCGGAITAGADVMTTEQVVTTVANQITVTGAPTNFTDTSGLIGWYKLPSQDDSAYLKIDFTGSVASVNNLPIGTMVCVKYPIVSNASRKFRVNTQFVPSVVRAQLNGGIFKVGTTGAVDTNSSKIATVTINVPQFQFDGNVTLSLSSTTIASIPLSGQALANYTGSCDQEGWYAEIIETPVNGDAFTNVVEIAVADGGVALVSGGVATLSVYNIFNNGTNSSLVSNSELTFIAETGKGSIFTVSADGIITAGSTAGDGYINILVTSKPSLTGVAYVTVTTA